MIAHPRDRRGFILVLALLALTLISALIAALALSTSEDFLVAHNTTQHQHAAVIADQTLIQTVTQLDSIMPPQTPIATTTTITHTTDPQIRTVTHITKLDTTLFLLTTTATITHASARTTSTATTTVHRTPSAATSRATPLPDRP